MKAALAKGPVSVAIEADNEVFQAYDGGILNSKDCGTQLDHGVLAVGFGHDNATKQDYYIVKNSWGSGWGDNGYIKIAAVEGPGICGIQSDAVYPLVNKQWIHIDHNGIWQKTNVIHPILFAKHNSFKSTYYHRIIIMKYWSIKFILKL